MTTIIVTTSSDNNDPNDSLISLREAIALAALSAGSDTIEFDASISQITLNANSPLVIAAGNNVTINGDLDGDGQADILISGNNATQLFNIQSGGTLRLETLALANGRATGSSGNAGSAGGNGYDSYASYNNGETGDNGSSGGGGGNAAGLIYNAGTLDIVRTSLGHGVALGGAGGAGGAGGSGGRGYDGYYDFGDYGGSGENGSNGGNAGSGGNGGNGGSAAGAIFNRSGASLTLTDSAFSTVLVHETGAGSLETVGGFSATAGSGGAGGNGGRGGNGGSGANGYRGTYDYDYYSGTRTYTSPGGNGGNGGNSGNGGNGGIGGAGGHAASAILNFGTISGITAIGSGFGATAGSAGASGNGGTAGSAGGAGSGAGGAPNGHNGSNGISGSSGAAGAAGTAGSASQTLYSSTSHSVTISDSLIYLHAGSLQVTEGSSGGTDITFQINRIGDFSESTSVDWTVSGGTGLTGADFVGGALPSGTATFTSGATTSVTVTLHITGDLVIEGDESFSITLSNLSDTAGGAVQGLGTSVLSGQIINDDADAAPQFVDSLTSATVDENTTGTVFSAAATDDGIGGTTLTYSLGGTDGALFDIDDNGNIRFLTAPDAETPGDSGHDGVYDFTVVVTDGIDGHEITKIVALTVADVKEATTVTLTALNDAYTALTNDDFTLYDLAGDDTITTNDGDDFVRGGNGKDLIDTGGGADTMVFGSGADTYDGGAGADLLVAAKDDAYLYWALTSHVESVSGGGFDNVRILGATGADLMDFSGVALTDIASINAGAGNDTVIGSGAADMIRGASGRDLIDGAGGADTLVFESGLDTYDGGDGSDILQAGKDGAYLYWALTSNVESVSGGGFSGVKILGSSSADLLDFSGIALSDIAQISAGSGNDTVVGSATDDVISGGGGKDRLSGGDGDDRFVYTALSDSKTGANWDLIVDFAQGSDTIDLSGLDANTTLDFDQDFAFIGATAFSGLAGQLRFDNSIAGYTRILGDVNGDSKADFEIRVDWSAVPSHTLFGSDFML